jgi:hypothetical protein
MEAIESLGKASPRDIHLRVAARCDVDAHNEAFVRSVYRDLKQLADEGRLHVRAYAPDGTEIEPEKWDETKNFRLEYSLSEVDSQIAGWKLLDEIGSRVFPGSKTMGWKVCGAGQAAFTDHVSLLFKGKSSRCSALQLPISQLPAKVLFVRTGEILSDVQALKRQVAEVIGLKATIFMCSDPTVSRFEPGQRMGHALLTITRTGELECKDLGSFNGTFFAPISESEIHELARNESALATQKLRDEPFADLAFSAVSSKATPLSNPTVLRLGSFSIGIVLKGRSITTEKTG